MDFNKIFLSGRIIRDVEFYSTVHDRQILKFNIEVIDRKVHNIFTIVIFGDLAEKAKKELKKDKRVFVEGRLRYSQFRTRTGAFRSRIEVIADKIFLIDEGGFLDGKPKSTVQEIST